MKKFKTIGVLGGMGPCASAYFYQLLLHNTQKKYQAIQDYDYPHIVINSLALNGSNEYGMEKSKLILDQLIKGVNDLENINVDFIVITCNSVHNVLDKLVKKSNKPILSIIDEVSKQVKENKSKKVLVLSSETTEKYSLYNGLTAQGIEVIQPNKKLKSQITKLILCTMGGFNAEFLKAQIIDEIQSMYWTKEIDSVILGCTELPLALKEKDIQLKVYDSLQILAESALSFAKND